MQNKPKKQVKRKITKEEYKKRIELAIKLLDIYSTGINLGTFTMRRIMNEIKSILKGDETRWM